MRPRHFSVLAAEGLVKVQAKVLPENLAQAITTVSTNPAEKIRRAVLYQELNATKRRLIFRPTKAHLVNQFDLPTHKGESLNPTEYLGVPSQADFSKVVSEVSSAEQAMEITKTLEQCISHKTTARNVKPSHISTVLRKAAEFGNYEQVYQYISVRSLFAPLLSSQVYLDALRIVAIRVPSKSRDVKSLLFDLYKRSPKDARREAALLYGLTHYEKADVSKQIEECSKRLDFANLSTLEPVDGALLLQAGQKINKQFQVAEEGDDTIVYTVAV